MPDTAADVSFDRALEILEMGEVELERLLVDGVLRGYRSGNDIVFRRGDIADYITRQEGPGPMVQPAMPEPTPPAEPIQPQQTEQPQQMEQPQQTRTSGRDSIDSIKRAAMAGGGEKEGMWSLKKYAVEAGWMEEPPPAEGPPSGEVPAGAAPAEGDDLAAENEALRERLSAAEEVLGDLQGRLEKVSQIEAQYQAAVGELTELRNDRIEYEAKLAAFEEMESDTGGLGFGAPEPEQQVFALKRENAEMRGEMAVLKRKVEDRESDAGKLKAERDEVSAKLAAAEAGAGADESEQVRDLQGQLDELTEERDVLAVEAEVARELKGEIERAAELEEKLQTQREVIEAAQKGLMELEGERDELSSKVNELEGSLSSATSTEDEARERTDDLQAKLAEAEQRAAQFESRSNSLREERDKLTGEGEKLGEEMARLRADAEKARGGLEELERARAELAETKSRATGLEAEAEGLKIQVMLKEQLVEQLKVEEHDQVELTSDNARLREKVAEFEGRVKQAEARTLALRSERDGLTAEVAKHDGAIDELRAQAEHATSLLVENRALKQDIDAVREKLAEAEPAVVALSAERERLAAETGERASRIDELEKTLKEREAEIAAARAGAPVGAAAAPAAAEAGGVRAELESLRAEISRQMQELGQTRLRATTKGRSAIDVAGRKRVPTTRKRAAASREKPGRLGRYEIGAEVRRSRVGVVYKGEVQPTGGEVDVLVLATELTNNRSFLDRFWREMRVIAELDEGTLLAIMDVGEAAGLHYIAYESVEGETLEATLLRDGKVAAPRAAEITASVLDGLAAVAKNKLVHGDVKPGNVIVVSASGPQPPAVRVKLAGLGLRRGGEDDAVVFRRGEGAEGGVTVGHYGAPEQILGRPRDEKSDMFSAGAVLYHMVTGRPPIIAHSVGEAKALIQAGELQQMLEGAGDLERLPDNLRKSLGRLLAEAPDERYRSAIEAARSLRKLKLE